MSLMEIIGKAKRHKDKEKKWIERANCAQLCQTEKEAEKNGKRGIQKQTAIKRDMN